MKRSDSSGENEGGDIRRKKIIAAWARGKPPNHIADEMKLPVGLVYRILKNIQKEFTQRTDNEGE